MGRRKGSDTPRHAAPDDAQTRCRVRPSHCAPHALARPALHTSVPILLRSSRPHLMLSNDLCTTSLSMFPGGRTFRGQTHGRSGSSLRHTRCRPAVHRCRLLLYVLFSAWYMTQFSQGISSTVEVVRPTLPLPWLTTPICALIAFNLFMHYFWVCTVAPGFVEDPPREHGSGWLWAQPRSRRRPLTGAGVRWSEEVNITRASWTRCKRCKELRPEVSGYSH